MNPDVLPLIRPGEEWVVRGDVLEWLSDTDVPSEAEMAEGEVLLGWKMVRAERDVMLAASDWTQMPDAPLTAAEKQAWAVYRQTLRDIPQDFATPDAVVWPTPPS